MTIQSEPAVWASAMESSSAEFVLRSTAFPNAATLVLLSSDSEGKPSELLVAWFAQIEPGLVVLRALGEATGAKVASEIEGHPVKAPQRTRRKATPAKSPSSGPVETTAAPEPAAPESTTTPKGTPAPTATRHATMLWLVKNNPGITVGELQQRPELAGYGAAGRQTRKDLANGKLTGSATEGLHLGEPGRELAMQGAPSDRLTDAFGSSADAPSATARIVAVVAAAGPVSRDRLREIFEPTLPTVQRQINKQVANGRLALVDGSLTVTAAGRSYLKSL